MQISERATVEITITGPSGSARLTPNQSAILKLLHDARGGIVAHDTIIDVVWGKFPPSAPARVISTEITRIRRALDAVGLPRQCIQNAISAGFRLDA